MVPEFFHIVIVGLMILIPLYFIYKKTGLNPLFSLLIFIPGFGLLLIFLQLALFPWPNIQSTQED